MTRSEVETTCRVLAEKMASAQVEEADHDGKERLHRTLKEAARSRRDALRSVIVDLDPDFFGARDGGVTDKSSNSAEVTQSLGTNHKSRYGQWANIANGVLRAAGGSGTFQQLRDIARNTGLVPSDTVNEDMEGLRGALHGLRRRSTIGYRAGKDGAGGVFFVLDNDKEDGDN